MRPFSILKAGEKAYFFKPFQISLTHHTAIESFSQFDRNITWKKIIQKNNFNFFLHIKAILRQRGLGGIFQVKTCFRRFVFEILTKREKMRPFSILKAGEKAYFFKPLQISLTHHTAIESFSQFDRNITWKK